MEEKEILNKLREFNVKPTKQWQEETLEKLNISVTKSVDIRNSNTNLLKFLNLSNMNMKFKAIVSIATVVVTFTALGALAYASDPAQPGDPLFEVDKAMEQIRRTLTINPLDRAEYEMRVMDERMEELRQRSYEENALGITKGINEVEAQQLRLQNMFEQMYKLRSEGDSQEAQRQLEVMNRIATKLALQDGILTQTREKLNANKDEGNSEQIDKLQYQYMEQVQNQIGEFENETGLKVMTNEQTKEQNQGEDTQIQNQIQNSVNTGDSNGASQGVQGVSNGSNGNGGR